ncbi:hypothetical protein [Paludisphaera rhizosphaerae]|uniref:hypothetical protein n=1 Tax=Paludisphaera rhizosphaerae TaxID=2711216 RepID=UPI0013EE2AB2|nr:hypothetical protein [Paludisphaera rhizosphaerae]
MRRNALLALAVFVLVAGFATFLPAQAPKLAVTPTWEYRVISLNEVIYSHKDASDVCIALEAKFNLLGKEGFDIYENMDNYIVFKRQKR